MITTFKIKNKIYSILKAPGSGISVQVIKGNKPVFKTEPDEYIVIPDFRINPGVMQKCIVNVNYHIKYIGTGIQDEDKLDAGTDAVIALLDGYSDTIGSYRIEIDLDDDRMQETILNEALKEHYSNIRFSVKIINTL